MKVDELRASRIYDQLVTRTGAPPGEHANFVNSISSGAGRYEYKTVWEILRDVIWTFINGDGLWAVEVDFQELTAAQAESVIACNEYLLSLLRLHVMSGCPSEADVLPASRKRERTSRWTLAQSSRSKGS